MRILIVVMSIGLSSVQAFANCSTVQVCDGPMSCRYETVCDSQAYPTTLQPSQPVVQPFAPVFTPSVPNTTGLGQ